MKEVKKECSRHIKYIIKSRVGYHEKHKKKKRHASINHDGLFELYKVKENGTEAAKSYKKIVLSLCDIEIFRRQRERSIHVCILQPNRRSLEIIICDEKATWLAAFKEHARKCPSQLPPEVPTRTTLRDRGFKSSKEAAKVSRGSMTLQNSVYEDECIAGQLRVLLPSWFMRYCTLCSNGLLKVYKGTHAKSGLDFEVNLNEFDLNPDQDSVASNFYITPRNLIDNKYSHPLSLDINQIETQYRAMWMKYLTEYMPEKRRHEQSFKSESLESTPKIGHKFSRSSTKTSFSYNRDTSFEAFPQDLTFESEFEQIRESSGGTSNGYISESNGYLRDVLSPSSTVALDELMKNDSNVLKYSASTTRSWKTDGKISNVTDHSEGVSVTESKVSQWMEQNEPFQNTLVPDEGVEQDYLKSMLNLDYAVGYETEDKQDPEKVGKGKTRKKSSRKERKNTRLQIFENSDSSSSASEAWLTQSNSLRRGSLPVNMHMLLNNYKAENKMEHIITSYNEFEGSCEETCIKFDSIISNFCDENEVEQKNEDISEDLDEDLPIIMGRMDEEFSRRKTNDVLSWETRRPRFY